MNIHFKIKNNFLNFFSSFVRYGARWESSFLCRLSGFLCVFSSQTGLFLLTVAALERCHKTDGHKGVKTAHTQTHTHASGEASPGHDLFSPSLQVVPCPRSPSVWLLVCALYWAWPSHCPPWWLDTAVPPSVCHCLPPPPHPPWPSLSPWCSLTPCVSSS